MMDCDRECSRCTYADCMSNDYEDQRKQFDIQNRRPKSKSIKVLKPKDYYDIEEYNIQSPSRNYDF